MIAINQSDRSESLPTLNLSIRTPTHMSKPMSIHCRGRRHRSRLLWKAQSQNDTHVYVHVYTYIYRHVCTHTFPHVYTNVYTHVYTQVYTHAAKEVVGVECVLVPNEDIDFRGRINLVSEHFYVDHSVM